MKSLGGRGAAAMRTERRMNLLRRSLVASLETKVITKLLVSAILVMDNFGGDHLIILQLK